jgi:Domain of unknown function (DUF397)
MTSDSPNDTAEWIKASTSTDSEQYVEMRRDGDAIEVRDAKDGETGPILRFTPAEWDAWLDGAKKGEFDHLI